MVSFSVWHGLITLLVLFLYIGLPVLAIAKENTEIVRSRREFFLRIAAGVGVLLLMGTVSVLLGGDEETNNAIGALFYFVIAYPLYQLYVRRARDAGMGKLIAYLTIIPGVFLVTTLILLFKPSPPVPPGNEVEPNLEVSDGASDLVEVGEHYVNEEEKNEVSEQPIKKATPRGRKIFLGWAVVSIIWTIGVINSHWDGLSPLFEDGVISAIHVDTEIIVTPEKIIGLGLSNSPYNYPHSVPNKKLESGSDELATIREFFPSFKDKGDDEFSDFLWRKVQTNVAKRKFQRAEHTKNEVLEVLLQSLFPALIILVPVFLINWLLRKYFPQQMSPYAKKIFIIALFWVMGVGTWLWLFGENYYGKGFFDIYFFVNDEASNFVLQLIFFPPIIIIIAAMLWSWAKQTPSGKEG